MSVQEAESVAAELTARLHKAATLLTPDTWTTGREGSPDDKMCLTGAVRFCDPKPGDAWIVRQVLRKLDHAEAWNDSRAGSVEAVTSYMFGLDITDELLAATFGPDWQKVVDAARASGRDDWTVLSGAVLRGAVLSGADLSDADLRDADLRDAVLRGADLSGAVLRGAVLRDAVLRGADLRGADLRGADLRGADLRGADLRDAVLRDAYWPDKDKWEIRPSGLVVAKTEVTA